LIHVADDFPATLPSDVPVEFDNCQAAALNLCSAIYEYLAMALKYLPRSSLRYYPFLFPLSDDSGNNLSALVKPYPMKVAESKIIKAREAYKFALSTLGTKIGMELWTKVDIINEKVDEIPSRVQEKAEGSMT